MTGTKHGWDNLRPFQAGDLSRVWLDLRQEDRWELEGGGIRCGKEAEAGLALTGSRMKTWDTDIGPVAVVGSTPTDNPDVGLIWAVASSFAVPRWRFAAKNTESLIRWCGEGYSVLSNYKDTRNTTQINWLQRTGFTFVNRLEGANGLTYIEFMRMMK